jgi:hypothetical protein
MRPIERCIDTDQLSNILQYKIFPDSYHVNLDYLDLGLKGIVLNCDIDYGKEFVVRCVKDLLKVRKLEKINTLLSQSNCHFPRLLLMDTSLATYARLGAFVICEEKIEGPQLQEVCLDTKTLVQLAQNIARLHSITKRQWTKKQLMPHYGSFSNYCMRGISKNLKLWFATRMDFDRSHKKAYYDWFNKYKPEVGWKK